MRLGDNILVMCECWMSDGKPNAYNFRHDAEVVLEAHKEHEIWFGLEQEYTLLNSEGWPFGWPRGGFPGPQGPYYCGVGTGKVYCRDIVEAHYKACLFAGIQISGTNAEVMPAQWEYQVGPCVGIARRFFLSSFCSTCSNQIDQSATSFGCPASFSTASPRSLVLA
jgi:glutamine synthetase